MRNFLTRVLIAGSFFGWIAWDVYLAKHGDQTESMVLADWASKCIVLPNLVGFLCGHWFFRRRVLWTSGWMWAIPIWVAMGAWDIWYHFHPSYLQGVARYPLWWVLIGIPQGSYLWGQSDGASPIR